MKLSEAIRLGSTLCDQRFRSNVGDSGERCALLSAGFAMGVTSGLTTDSSDLWPWLERLQDVLCPVCERRDAAVWVIICLNDSHNWTREHIANFVQSIEPDEPKPLTSDDVERLRVSDLDSRVGCSYFEGE